MRSGTLWRFAVLVSLAVLTSGQLCMLTTCLPRLHRMQSVATHACCRTTPMSPARSSHGPGPMPCDMMLHSTAAPDLAAASPLTLPAALVVTADAALSLPPRFASGFDEANTGPPPGRFSPAPAGLRAPPQA